MVELMMAEDESGRWAARTTGRGESRQNGKGDELEVMEAWGLVQRGEWVLHTAHELATAKSAQRRLVDFLELHKDLRRLIRQVRYANSDRSIELINGSIIVYRTRTTGGGRGLDDISRLVVDEAQWAQEEQLASSLPILAANPNPQTNFVGSAGIEGRSDWWWSMRLRALRAIAGEDAGAFGYMEHTAERVELSQDGKVVSELPDVNDRAEWYGANPALGVRIEEAFLDEQLQNLGERLFAREHLNVWDPYPNQSGGFLPVEEWGELTVDDPKPAGVCWGLAVSEHGAVFASAGRLGKDLYVDVVAAEEGTDWVVERAQQGFRGKPRHIRVHPGAPEGSFIRPLRDAGIEVDEVASRAYAQACGEFLDALKNGTIRHLGQAELDRAVRAVQRRDHGSDGLWVWAEPPDVDVAALRAATIALSGVEKRRPPTIHVYEES
ncbi:MAG: hypothetical protein GEU73_07600 [Chloroflexi bacterium]|nr:hypothetical protein [Chloroflexota bacterium]